MASESTREKPVYLPVQRVVADRVGSRAYTNDLPPIYRR